MIYLTHKYTDGQEVLVVNAGPAATSMIGTKQIIKRQLQLIKQKEDTEGTCPSDWYVVPAYELVGNKAWFREEWLELCDDNNITVTEDEFDSIFG